MLIPALDIIGHNSFFVGQSGTFSKRFEDFSKEDAADKTARGQEQVHTVLHKELDGVPVTPESTKMWRLLNGLGSHDLSVMREALGMPSKVVGSSLGGPFWKYVFLSSRHIATSSHLLV